MKILFQILIVFTLPLFNSCNKDDQGFKTYTISVGKHNSKTHISVFSQDELRFLAKFDNTAIYSTKDPINQHDTNKLYGFSDCGDLHHVNSARFGWRWFNNQLEIYAYCYTNSTRDIKFVSVVQLNQEYDYRIKVSGNQYLFSVNGNTVSMPRGCSKGGTRYRLFPYFGGDETAPHDIHIKIKEL